MTVLHTLNTQQLGDVLLCMEFLNTKEAQAVNDDPLWLAITREANPNVT